MSSWSLKDYVQGGAHLHNPVNTFTLSGVVRDARLTVEQFRELLQAGSDAQPALVRTERLRRRVARN